MNFLKKIISRSINRKLQYGALLGIFLLSFFAATAQKATPQTARSKTVKTTADVTVTDTSLSNIVSKIQVYSFKVRQDSSLIHRSLNITPITSALPGIEARLTAFRARLDKSGRQMNLMGLNTFLIFMKESVNQLNGYKSQLTDYYNQLSQNNTEISKIINDQSLNIVTPDSGLAKQIQDLRAKAARLDTAQYSRLAKITVVRNRISIALLNANDIISNLTYFMIATEQNMWHPEEQPLLKARPSDYDQSFFSLLKTAVTRASMIMYYYLTNAWGATSVALLIFILITFRMWLNMRRIKKFPDRNKVLSEVYFLRPNRIIIGSIFVFFTYAPFIYGNPPMAVLHTCALLRTVLLFILLYPYFRKTTQKLWMIFCVLWLYYMLDDLFSDSAFAERWLLFIAGVLFSLLCFHIVRSREPFFQKIQESPAMKTLAMFCFAQAVLSLIFNLTGRVTLTKMFGVSAVQCLMLGITLKVLCTMVLEAIYMQSEAYRDSRFSEYLNYKVLERKYKKILWAAACFIWFIGLLRNWNLYNLAVMLVTIFFAKQRTLGGHAFSFGSIAVFIGVIWISVIVSRFINFFFGRETGTPSKRNNLASVMLLIRLAIWAVGFLIAVTAAGIPMSKITIMLGALSVGIGFGLQNIANNLVSGVILAFERPIQVGDQIEISGKSGKVKEIGVRSSKLSTSDGADLIIPNGDLLSQQLTNWTMRDLYKSVSFNIAIDYSTDILGVKKIIMDCLNHNGKILKQPAPSILLDTFADSAMNVKITVWVPDLSSASSTRSQVMIDVYQSLLQAGVKLPYPMSSTTVIVENAAQPKKTEG